jgi:hypothetical protein
MRAGVGGVVLEHLLRDLGREFSVHRQNLIAGRRLILWFGRTAGSPMLTALLVILRSIGLIWRGHRAVALENFVLR